MEKSPFQFAAANLFTVDCTFLLIFKKHCLVRKQLLCSLFNLKTVQYETKFYENKKGCKIYLQKDSVTFSNGKILFLKLFEFKNLWKFHLWKILCNASQTNIRRAQLILFKRWLLRFTKVEFSLMLSFVHKFRSYGVFYQKFSVFKVKENEPKEYVKLSACFMFIFSNQISCFFIISVFCLQNGSDVTLQLHGEFTKLCGHLAWILVIWDIQKCEKFLFPK